MISELKRILGKSIVWNKWRIDCLARLIPALIAVRTVNLREIALAMHGTAIVDAKYKRLVGFFAAFEWDFDALALWLKARFFRSDEPIYLTIDRTNWYWGKFKINILMVAAAYEGTAIPLIWQMLDKAGSASALEHIQITKRFRRIFYRSQIAGLLGDREFANGALFAFCNLHQIPLYIRIKDNCIARISKKRIMSLHKLFKHLEPKEKSEYAMKVQLFDVDVYLAASRSERGELMIVATNQPPQNAIAIYLRRWEIECLFQATKGRGFNFEATHLCSIDAINRMMAVVAIAFSWAHLVGEHISETKPILLNYHKKQNQRRPQYSYFRYGLNLIREAIFNSNFIEQARKWLNILNDCPQKQQINQVTL